jgi:hypothetical protein
MSDLLDLAYPVANYTTDHALARRGHHRQRSARLRKEGLPSDGKRDPAAAVTLQ